MLHRELRLPAKRSCLLLGPRQSGKSTLVRSYLGTSKEPYFTIDLLREDVELRYTKDPGQFAREIERKVASGCRLVFVDEVQKAPGILNEIHRLIEEHSVRFLKTGSSARKLRRGGANLLGGRASIRHLHPLTLREQGDAFDLERTLRFGSLPAVVTGDDETASELLRAYANTYLREEIQAEAIVRNLGGFARFLDVVAAQCGELLNFSSVGRDAALATRTVQEYYQVLEDTLLGLRVEAWKTSPRARLVAHPKFYLFDTGVTNAINRRLAEPPDSVTRGRLYEQFVVLESHRLLDYAQSEARLYFWRTHNGAEVDLLVEKHGKIRLAVEVKSGRIIRGSDVTGLRSFAEAHPTVPRVVVAPTRNPYTIDPKIEVMSVTDYLARLEEIA